MAKHADLLLKALPGEKEFSRVDKEGEPFVVRKKDAATDMYYWHWGSIAMSQMDKGRWASWKKEMKRAALGSQCKGVSSKGSWDPTGPWGYAGGRVYATAMMVSVLAKVL